MTVSTATLTPEQLQIELQSYGLQLENLDAGASGRKGGAGPSDHKAIRIHGSVLMVPVFNSVSTTSPYYSSAPNELGVSTLFKHGQKVSTITFPKQPNFYKHFTSDGVPMWKIAQLHSENVLATTVLQNCIRYYDRSTSCQFCAIGQSLKAERTIAFKTPQQLAEVAKVAFEEDGIVQFIMTTGTPSGGDRGAKLLYESLLAVKAAVPTLPIQVQCEPPDDFAWFQKLKDAGADALGMHLEAVTEKVRHEIMPGKAEVSVSYYMEAFADAVQIFGRGNVSTYILAGLGDTAEEILNMSLQLVDMGVYPFVVPFVPISGTPLQSHSSPSQSFMQSILEPLAVKLNEAHMTSDTLKAGCAKCAACSTLKSFENKTRKSHGI